MAHAKEIIEQLTPSEYQLVSTKLDESINSKEQAGLLQFSPSDEIADPNSSINMSMFGLHDSDSLRRFLLTPAGETVIHEIGTELSLERAIKEEHQLQIQEEIKMHERRRALLFHWFLSEEAEAKKAQDEIVQMQQEQILKSKENVHKVPLEKKNKALEDAIERYDDAVKEYQEQQKELEAEENTLNEELANLNEETQAINDKHQTYDNVLNAYDKSASTYEKNPEMLDREIASLERQMDRMTQHIFDELDKGNDKEARKLLNQQNALNLQMGTLKDIKSKQDNQKVFLDSDLKSEGVSYDKAMFAMPKEQAQRLVKHKGEYLLLDKGEKLDDIKDDMTKLQNAKARFEKAKSEIMSVKNVVHHVKQQELELNTSRIDETRSKIAVNKAEQLMVKNQINLMHSARANIRQSLIANPDLAMQSPQSSITPANNLSLGAALSRSAQAHSRGPSTPMMSQQQVFSGAAFVQTINSGKKPVTWGSLFTKIKTIHDKQVQDELDKYVTDVAKEQLTKEQQKKLDPKDIKSMLEKTPIPDETMKSLLQNLPRFGEDSYKNAVTAEVSPIEKRGEHVSTPTLPR